MSSHLLTSTMVVALLAPNLAWANEHSEHTEPAADGVPQGLTLDDWQSIRDAHDAYRLGVRAVEGGHTAHNPAQGWTTRFDARGFELRPAGGEWSWGLDLSSYGRESCETSPDVRRDVTVEGVRLEYHWDDLMTEWYVNEARGLEHGYTLHARPEGEGELELRIAVRGTLRPTVESGGRDVRFSDSSGRTRLVYAGLVVFDAGGRRLDAGFTLAADELLLTVDDEGARYPITIDPLAQLGYLKASNTQAQDIFGNQVAISGDTVVVAAPTEDSGATGVNGDQTFDSASGSGAAYVFVRTGPVWSQQAYLKASNTSPDDLFGISLGISGDTIVVGASLESSSSTGVDGNQSNSGATGSGAAYVFVRAGGTWSQQAFLKASNTDAGDHFGDSVAVSGDTIVVGAYSESSDAVGVNGIETSNSADEAGAAYVFVRQGTSWSQEAYLKASNTEAFDQFGKAVGVSGDTIAVGAILEAGGAAGVNGDETSNSDVEAGAVYVFRRAGSVWSQEAYVKPSNTDARDRFGSSVSLSGNTLVVGAPLEESNATGVNGNEGNNSKGDSGAAYVFFRSGTTWTQQAYLKASNTDSFDEFGSSVSVSGDTVLVGAPREKSDDTGLNGTGVDNSLERAGAAYVFTRTGTVWQFDSYVKASNTGFGDLFGTSVSVSGGQFIVGAPREGSIATGFNGDQGDDGNASRAGAAYVFGTPSGDLSFCYGDGLGRPCKCGNDDALNPGTGGCLNSNGTGAVLSTNAQTSVTGNALEFALTGGVPTALAVLTSGDNALGIGLGILGLPESDGLRCVGANLRRHGSRSLNALGATAPDWGAPMTGPPGGIIGNAGFVAGQSRYFQVRYRENPATGPCGFGTNTSQAIAILFTP